MEEEKSRRCVKAVGGWGVGGVGGYLRKTGRTLVDLNMSEEEKEDKKGG